MKLWADANGKEPSAAFTDPDFKAEMVENMASLATKLKLNSLEKPKEIFITSEPFSIDNGILTPTMKLKRHIGYKVYAEQIEKMYDELKKRGL